jgi:hypothetical protein
MNIDEPLDRNIVVSQIDLTGERSPDALKRSTKDYELYINCLIS